MPERGHLQCFGTVWARYLKEHGSTEGYLDQMLSFDEYFEFIGARAIREREKQWVMEAAGAVEKSNPPISA